MDKKRAEEEVGFILLFENFYIEDNFVRPKFTMIAKDLLAIRIINLPFTA